MVERLLYTEKVMSSSLILPRRQRKKEKEKRERELVAER